MTIHPAAAGGFGKEAETYDRGRPDYPPAIDAWLSGRLGLKAGSTVLDLAAGTGKFTRRLQKTQARLIAVEPVAAMRAQFAKALPEIEILDGTAEAIPLPDASLDAVISAQAFHWFANRQALAEIRRVLKPGGVLGLVWNARDESVDWVHALSLLIAPFEGTAPRFASGVWRRVFPAAGFGPLEETRFAHVHEGPIDQVIVDRLLSVSFIAALPDDRHAEVEAAIRALIAGHPALRDKKNVRFPYETRAYCCEAIPLD